MMLKHRTHRQELVPGVERGERRTGANDEARLPGHLAARRGEDEGQQRELCERTTPEAVSDEETCWRIWWPYATL